MTDDLFSKNYFEIFDVAVGFDVDLAEVESVHRELQKTVHPDRFAGGSEQQRRIAMQQTSLINQAFQTLRDPVLRAQYLLSLKGIDMQNETDTTMDAEFLMEQMEFREAIADVRDKADPLDLLDTMRRESKQKIEHYMDEFARHFAADQLDAARETVRKMQFLFKAQKEISTLSEQIEDELL